MGELNVYDIKGSVVDTLVIDDNLLNSPVRTQAVNDVVVAFLANQRTGTANTKTRNEVSASTAKPWRQKGTGRARSGMRSSPIWRGGGTVFGPKPRDFRMQTSKKLKQAALRSILVQRLNAETVTVITALELNEPKTKSIVSLLGALNVTEKKVLIVTESANLNVLKSARNITGVNVTSAMDVNTYEIINSDRIVIEQSALEILKKRIGA
ncbi:MAG: 50S ribosomal protein L4 [Candidatus Auribacter fodinae]|jgi:large subunit ribosomal protein L4|uniref:Large ribosomal subunit protein uL4 n=1 Tax=Candidatus Auribacter fodinae TaxID=2093366 RepID=A0A3A4R7X0_9BACT|nr:MAG: 50S ribosomal protein L4 [Candidatus Auribacter fodinae]